MSEYDTLQSKSLGNHSTYESEEQKINVMFQPDLSSGYYSAISLTHLGGDGIGYDLSQGYDDDIVVQSNDKMHLSIDTSGQEVVEKPIYSIGKSQINSIFIGSVTVLGLFILYRMLQK